MSVERLFFLAVVVLVSYAPPAHAYIDPGVVYALVQAAFVVVFGGAVAWVMRPWTYLKGLFRRKDADAEVSVEDGQDHRGSKSGN